MQNKYRVWSWFLCTALPLTVIYVYIKFHFNNPFSTHLDMARTGIHCEKWLRGDNSINIQGMIVVLVPFPSLPFSYKPNFIEMPIVVLKLFAGQGTRRTDIQIWRTKRRLCAYPNVEHTNTITIMIKKHFSATRVWPVKRRNRFKCRCTDWGSKEVIDGRTNKICPHWSEIDVGRENSSHDMFYSKPDKKTTTH